MSRQRALEGLNLNKTDRIPRWIPVPPHAEFLEKLTGLDPILHPVETSLKAIELLDLDVADYYDCLDRPNISGYDTGEVDGLRASRFYDLARGKGRATTTWKQHALKFGVEDVLNYDVEQHALNKTAEEFEQDLRAARAKFQERQKRLGDLAWIGEPVNWYNTVFMWGVTTFGWEAFMMAAVSQPERYAEVLARFTDVTRRYFAAGAKLPGLMIAEAHDDLCMTRGPVFRPQWYRDYIFPLYPKVLQPLKERGIRVIYRGDGNVDEFVDDLAAAGFDGFRIRPKTDMGRVADKYGSTHLVIGNIDTTILTFKGKGEIYEDVKRCVQQAGNCPGYFFHVSGEIPYNVPTDNIFYLFEALEKFGRR